MKMIKEYVEAGISSVGELEGALQLAMQLEFATIPPYLCAQWSTKDDPDRVEGVLHKIVSQEKMCIRDSSARLYGLSG